MLHLIPKAYAQVPFQAEYSTWSKGLGTNVKSTVVNGNITDIVSLFLPYLLTIAGLVLFAMLVGGGFTMLSGAANKDSQEKGKKMVTSALTGFGIIFMAFWIAQILQIIFKIGIVKQ